MEVFVVTPTFRCSSFVFSEGSAARDVLDRFFPEQFQDFYVTSNGRLSHLEDPLQHGAVYRLEPRLSGGKGGFGSMLRALGAQIEKTTNREACRDLSGRRLRDVNHEKEMAEWLKKQADREAEKEQRRLERLQRKLAEPKHQFADPEYQQQCHELSERLEDSVLKGLQASSSCQVNAGEGSAPKRPSTNQSEPQKKKMKMAVETGFWTGLGDLDSTESSSEEDEESPSTSAFTETTKSVEPELSRTPRQVASDSCQSNNLIRPTSGCSSTGPTRPSEEQRPEVPSEEQRPEVPSEEQRPEVPSEEQGSEVPSEEQGSEVPSEEQGSEVPSEEQRPEVPSEEQGSEVPSEEQRPEVPSEEQRPEVPSEEQRPEVPSEEQRSEVPSEEQRPEVPSEEQRPEVPSEEQRPEVPSEEQGSEVPSEEQGSEVPSEEQGSEVPSEERKLPESSESRGPQQLDLSSVTSIQQLESLGLEVLKEELVSRGLKCGGTLSERATRLFSIRGLSPDQIDPVLLAKPVKPKKK